MNGCCRQVGCLACEREKESEIAKSHVLLVGSGDPISGDNCEKSSFVPVRLRLWCAGGGCFVFSRLVVASGCCMGFPLYV